MSKSTYDTENKDNAVMKHALNRAIKPAMVAEYKIHLPDKKLLQEKLRKLLKIQI
ncbi:MAG: hypothetical protein LBU10_03810 [Endomicrobium sp.]|jgi:hypothetical protein|nr:hypothetical protein [Endomicrobium sp.]